MPDSLRPRRPFTGNGSGDIGTLTHILVGAHVQYADIPTAHGDLLDRMFAVAYALIDANPNATRVLAAEAASQAHNYLIDCVPASPWTLLGIEFDTSDGPVDLAWVNMNNGAVMFDEIKTSRLTRARSIAPSWLTQARRYAVAGHETFGSSFAGTRLIPLTAVHESRLVTATGPTTAISPTPGEPLRSASPVDVPSLSRMKASEAQAVARANARGGGGSGGRSSTRTGARA